MATTYSPHTENGLYMPAPHVIDDLFPAPEGDAAALLAGSGALDKASYVRALTGAMHCYNFTDLEWGIVLTSYKMETGYSIRRIATELGRAKCWVENRLSLVLLDEDVRSVLTQRPSSLSIARLIQASSEPGTALRARLVEAAMQGQPLSAIKTLVNCGCEKPDSPVFSVSQLCSELERALGKLSAEPDPCKQKRIARRLSDTITRLLSH